MWLCGFFYVHLRSLVGGFVHETINVCRISYSLSVGFFEWMEIRVFTFAHHCGPEMQSQEPAPTCFHKAESMMWRNHVLQRYVDGDGGGHIAEG
jgi:hypothetical protein